jgi:ferredoxin-NADP reductase
MNKNNLINATITDVTTISTTIRKLRLEFLENNYHFNPGQWIDLHVELEGKNIGGYTITSSPSQKNFIELIVRKSNHHPVTIFLHQENILGKKVKITEGQGKFTLNNNSLINPPIFVAGGIGITPLLSMAKTLDEKNLKYQFYYSIKSPDDNILKHENIRDHKIFITQSNPRIKTSDLLENNQKDRDIYLCGPKGMIDELYQGLLSNQYPRELIHFEKWW